MDPSDGPVQSITFGGGGDGSRMAVGGDGWWIKPVSDVAGLVVVVVVGSSLFFTRMLLLSEIVLLAAASLL